MPGGDPLLKLIAVDWFKVDRPVNKVALHPKSLVQVGSQKFFDLIFLHIIKVNDHTVCRQA